MTFDSGRSDRTGASRWGDRGVGTLDRARDLFWGEWSVHGLWLHNPSFFLVPKFPLIN
jgi:hypothetical protein